MSIINNAINAPIPFASSQGGTGVASPTAHGIMVSEGTSPMNPIVLTNGQLLIGSTGGDPVAAVPTNGTYVSWTAGAGSLKADLTGTVPVSLGGTGQSSLNNNSLLVGTGTGGITQLSVGATGTVLSGMSGSNPVFTATPTVTSITIQNSPVASTDGVNKSYVDAMEAGLTFKDACVAATTANLTATYVSLGGVGDTLTNSGTLAVFTVDGQSPAVNSRILVKNQTLAYQNGIYTITNVGSGAVAWVLTRSTDYDQVSQIQPGDIIVVDTGTVNGGTSWLETATITAVGTAGNNINFSPFTYSPSAFLQVANNLSDLSNTATALTNLGLTSIATQSVTANDVLVGGPSNTIVSQPLTSGQLLIGSTGASPVAATLTAGSGVTITNASGSITIAATGGGSGGAVPNGIVSFTTTGTQTWTVPAGITRCKVTVVGGGAGGSGASNTSNIYAGVGGGAGGTAIGIVTGLTPGNNISVIVGGGGTGGGAHTNGNPGSASQFMSIVGGGGNAGDGGGTGGANSGGAGGNASGGSVNLIGGVGGFPPAQFFSTYSGNILAGAAGGASIFGGTPNAVYNGGTTGQYGSGGSGGSFWDGTAYSGGNGGNGIVIIEY